MVLPGEPGFHDLELRRIQLSFGNYPLSSNDFVTNVEIPDGFPSFAWDEIEMIVEVHDPVYGRDGRAFLAVAQLTVTTLPEPTPVPTLAPVPMALLAGGLLLAGALQFRSRAPCE